MDLLGNLKKLLGIQEKPQWQNRVPVGQALSKDDIARLPQQSRELAQVYNQNPEDERVASLDPAMFGYAADQAPSTANFNRITPGYQVAAQNYEANFNRGTTNSPYLVGNGAIDPVNFGYPSDGPAPVQRPGVMNFDKLLRRR